MKSLLCLAILSIIFVSGCGSGSTAPATDSSPQSAPVVKGNTDTKKGDEAVGKTDSANDRSFTYTVVTDEKDGKENKDTFTKDTPKIYVNFGWDKEIGSHIKGVWICEKAKDPKIPANTKIDEATLTIVSPMNAGDFSLSKPTAGWPEGDYKVELYSDDKLIKTAKFKIS